MEKLIARGAEADIYLGRWGPLSAIYKVRTAKQYMAEELDKKIRRQRTVREARMLRAARSAVDTPHVLYVSQKKYTIVMEYINGKRMLDIIDKSPSQGKVMGEILGRLHMLNIIHGDPNTANFLFDSKKNKWYLVDFGLSYISSRKEDMAVDLHLVKEVVYVQHPTSFKEIMSGFYDGYMSVSGKMAGIVKKIDEIERRGRYARNRSFLF
ncbi:MAG: Kae1-associated serine/threonine protein kinase [Nitrososphaerota archaeon]|jgi:TP53 regulating kinase-like protein|nr:Kae1-associated serine/threonine protein kinase [Nitrososphaerota archaeon]MDG6932871.1 Kae1-associated serine/threonine protein kinase [Nitrososphaerota archaeon]MDG6936286.1 Kae1-associated serine/threonine protein kinase [Nitrososphaerota archaeon]MDG6944916.1 Kae1-associated serine/threonine protein kinase [Nitrososphaerota archaeon]